MSVPMLSIRNLTVSFADEGSWRAVLHDVAFDVGVGETVAVVGESGSGKSVTALSAMRLLDAKLSRTQGSIQLGGRDVLAMSENDMEKLRGNEIAMIFQEPMTSLNPVLTIGEQIREVLTTHRNMSEREAEAEAVALLKLVRIPEAERRMKDYPHHFSGGMRQRVMIAIALACRPKLLIADEPTTALDVTIQAEILELLRQLKAERNLSMMFITHDMGVVAEIADRVVVMYKGKVVEEGTTTEIFSAPKHPYTKALLSAVPRLGSMQDEALPLRFPIVDVATGQSTPPAPSRDTVGHGEAPALEVKNLTVRFSVTSGLMGRVVGRVHAVENVSFSIQPGETLALIGESGCGKSTIGRTILGLNEPVAGDVVIAGQNLRQASPAQVRGLRRNLQMVFQDPFASLDPRFTIGDSIAEPLLLHKIENRSGARKKVGELLTQVGLSPEMATRYPHQFSGGQRQRICIARALALEPKVIVADESVSALDVSVKAQIVNLLLDLQQKMGLAYLFISHDMAVVERISHRLAVMFMGELVETGTREQIFSNPVHPYTKRLLAAVPVPEPGARRAFVSLDASKQPSPFRAADYVVPERQYRDLGDGHLVQEWDDSWELSA